MGMFDYVYCERKLPLTKEIKKAFPDKDWTKTDFQSKSLDNTMSSYYIKKNGYLYTEKVEGDHVRIMTEAEEKKIKKQGRFCWPYEFVERSRTSVKEVITDTINFYSYEDDDENNTWDIEFDAVFIKGKLISLKLVKGEITHTAEQNAESERKWKELAAAHEKHPWTKIKRLLNKITFGYWATFWKNITRILGCCARSFSAAQMWILKYMY
jgi:hypothetical protein